MKSALGLIETIGLVTAIEAADAGVKAANVVLLGYENTKGGGKITVKFAGEVGAVNAAVSAGMAAAARVGAIYSHSVIPRPHEEIDELIRNVDRGKGRKPAPEPATPAPQPAPVLAEPPAPELVVVPVAAEPAPEPEPVPELALAEPVAAGELAVAEPAAEPFQPTVQAAPRQCIAISKTGERCKRVAQAGSDYCYRHQPHDGNGDKAAA